MSEWRRQPCPHAHDGARAMEENLLDSILQIPCALVPFWTQAEKQAELEAVMANAPVAIMVTEGPIIRSASPRLLRRKA